MAIQIPADGIQLPQIGHFNESIAVRVVARVPRVSCIVWSIAVVVAVQLFCCLPHGYGECENAICIFVPYYDVVVACGLSLPHYLVPTSARRKVVVTKARKHPAASIVENHNCTCRFTPSSTSNIDSLVKTRFEEVPAIQHI